VEEETAALANAAVEAPVPEAVSVPEASAAVPEASASVPEASASEPEVAGAPVVEESGADIVGSIVDEMVQHVVDGGSQFLF